MLIMERDSPISLLQFRGYLRAEFTVAVFSVHTQHSILDLTKKKMKKYNEQPGTGADEKLCWVKLRKKK
jgi:hypothetical protein